MPSPVPVPDVMHDSSGVFSLSVFLPAHGSGCCARLPIEYCVRFRLSGLIRVAVTRKDAAKVFSGNSYFRKIHIHGNLQLIIRERPLYICGHFRIYLPAIPGIKADDYIKAHDFFVMVQIKTMYLPHMFM